VREVVNSNNAPETLSSDPQYGLVRAVMEAHWLDHKLVELAGSEPEQDSTPKKDLLEKVETEPSRSSISEKLDALKEEEDAFAATKIDNDKSDLLKAGAGIAATTAVASSFVSDRFDDNDEKETASFETESEPIESKSSVETPAILADEPESPESQNLAKETASNPILMNKVESLQSYCDELEQKLADMRRASKDVEVLSVLKSATQAFTLIDEIHEEAGESADWDSVDHLRSFAKGTTETSEDSESSDATSLGNQLLSKFSDSASDFGSSLLGDDSETSEKEPEEKEAQGPFNSFM
ncbi:MAG: hypothetical protein AAGH89_02910, partial [Verrucomicrobiota bacterium]